MPRLDVRAETRLFSHITSTSLNNRCAYAIVGHLSQMPMRNQSVTFKLNYLTLATKHGDALTRRTDTTSATTIRKAVGHAVAYMIEDIRQPHLQDQLLAVMKAYRINLVDQIAAHISFRALAMPTYMGNWMFNEYALCMNDHGAAERVKTVFAQSGSQDLRIIFSDLRGKYVRGGACIPVAVIQPLVRPYLDDERRTADVSGDGPPISHFARALLTVLK